MTMLSNIVNTNLSKSKVLKLDLYIMLSLTLKEKKRGKNMKRKLPIN